MKRKLLLVLSVLTLFIALILITTGVAGAVVSQTWYLHSGGSPSETGYYLMIREGNGTPSGEVTIGTGSSNIETWLSDETAIPASGVTFAAGTWTIYLHVTSDEPPSGEVLIGSYSSGVFVEFPGEIEATYDYDEKLVTVEITTSTVQTVPQDHYLALQITNYGDVAGTILCDGISQVISTDATPDFPLPEVATGILLAVGMVGLGTFIVIRRKRTSLVK
jgi:hypothetical protein